MFTWRLNNFKFDQPADSPQLVAVYFATQTGISRSLWASCQIVTIKKEAKFVKLIGCSENTCLEKRSLVYGTFTLSPGR